MDANAGSIRRLFAVPVWLWVAGAAFVPMLVAYYGQLWSLAHYQFFPLALLGAYLLARRAGLPSRAEFQRADLPIWPLGIGLGLLAAAVVVDSPWLGWWAAWLTGVAMVFALGGAKALWRAAPAFLMLLLTIRLPLNSDLRLISRLQSITVDWASRALDLLGMTHYVTGNVIVLPEGNLLVEAACSGISSLFSALACTLFFVLWRRQGWGSSVLLLLTVPFWVLLANAGRVVAVAVLKSRWQIPADQGWWHEALGLAIFVVAMLLIASCASLLRFYAELLDDDPATTASAPPSTAAMQRRATSASARRIVVAVGFLVLALQIPAMGARLRHSAEQLQTIDLTDLKQDLLPNDLGSWERAKYEVIQRSHGSVMGETSHAWTHVGGAGQNLISIDYPYPGWHDLADCYEAQGWIVEDRKIVPAKLDLPEYTVLTLRHTTRHSMGHLLFCAITRDGRPVHASNIGTIGTRWRGFLASLKSFPLPAEAEGNLGAPVIQLQSFTEAYAPLDKQGLAELCTGFLQAYAQLRTALNGGAP